MFIFAMAALLAAQAHDSSAIRTPTEKPKLICREIKVTGSRLARRRACGTARQWELTDKEAQEAVSDLQSQSAGGESMNEGAMGRGPG